VFLDGTTEGQPDAAARWILAKIRKDSPIEGTSHFYRPMFHSGVIVAEFRNIEANA
jgi:hypothetical protein